MLISHKEHKWHLLMYLDKRFQTDVNFPLAAFSHEQVKTSMAQSFLLADMPLTQEWNTKPGRGNERSGG